MGSPDLPASPSVVARDEDQREAAIRGEFGCADTRSEVVEIVVITFSIDPIDCVYSIFGRMVGTSNIYHELSYIAYRGALPAIIVCLPQLIQFCNANSLLFPDK